MGIASTQIFRIDLTDCPDSVLGKGMSAEVEISLRTASMSGAGSGVRAIPIETFSANKEMGRVLLRRGGETIAAGKP